MQKRFIAEQDLLEDSYRLAVQIFDSGFRPDFIVGVWRGGSTVGIYVQECLQYLGLETDHIAIRTSYRGREHYFQQLEHGAEMRAHGLQYLYENLNADDALLIVDDVYSTGLNVGTVIDRLAGRIKRNMPHDVRVAVPWYKPTRNRTGRVPDYYLHETDRWLVLPYRVYLTLFRPVVRLLNGVANLASRALGIQPRDELQSVHTASELAAIVAHSSAGGAIEADDAEILQGVIEFAQRPVGEIATPLADQPSVNLGATAGQLERIVTGGAGRVLVLDPRQRSRPIGYLHARDLLEVPPERHAAPVPAELVRNMALVQAEWSLVDVLLQMRRLRRHLALVESGGGPVAVVSQEQVVRALIQRRPIDVRGADRAGDTH